MYAVAGVSGNTGSVVASTLLAQGKKVRVIVRTEEKGRRWKERGAEVAIASLDNAAQLTKALSGIGAAFLLVPPDNQSTEFLARGTRFVAAIKESLAASNVKHVVFLSSIGAQNATGTGPIRTLHHAEEALAGSKAAFTWVRAAYFMENLAMSLYPIREQSILPALSDPDARFPMVATQDIGEVAAQALIDGPTDATIIELSGPKEHSFDDAAKLFGQALGKTITVVPVPNAGVVPALVQAGVATNVAELYLEMAIGIDSGAVAFQGGSKVRAMRGKVPLDTFIRRLLSDEGAASS